MLLSIARVINSELIEIADILAVLVVKSIQLRLPGQNLLLHLLGRFVGEQIVDSVLVLLLLVDLHLFVDDCLVDLLIQFVALLSFQVMQLQLVFAVSLVVFSWGAFTLAWVCKVPLELHQAQEAH